MLKLGSRSGHVFQYRKPYSLTALPAVCKQDLAYETAIIYSSLLVHTTSIEWNTSQRTNKQVTHKCDGKDDFRNSRTAVRHSRKACNMGVTTRSYHDLSL